MAKSRHRHPSRTNDIVFVCLNFYFFFFIRHSCHKKRFRSGQVNNDNSANKKMLILFLSSSVKWTVKKRLAWQNSIWLRNLRIYFPFIHFVSFHFIRFFSGFYHLFTFFLFTAFSQYFFSSFLFSLSVQRLPEFLLIKKSLKRSKIQFSSPSFRFDNQNINLFFHFG